MPDLPDRSLVLLINKENAENALNSLFSTLEDYLWQNTRKAAQKFKLPENMSELLGRSTIYRDQNSNKKTAVDKLRNYQYRQCSVFQIWINRKSFDNLNPEYHVYPGQKIIFKSAEVLPMV